MITLKKHLVVTDGVEWKALRLYNAADNFVEQRAALDEVGKLLGKIEDDFIRNSYSDLLVKKLKVKKKDLDSIVLTNLDKPVDPDQGRDMLAQLPDGVDPDEWMQFGFYDMVDEKRPMNTGFYFNEGQGREQVKRSNFVLRPLFHLYSKETGNNKRMIEINNGFEKKILDLPSRSMLSIDQFTAAMYDEGNFLFEGNKIQLLKINRKIGGEFPLAWELTSLGWQEEGVFAFANCLVDDKVRSFNEMGIATHNEKNFFSPSCSVIYNSLRKDDDPYENDRFLNMKPSPVDFGQWAVLMSKVYGEHAMIGILYVLVTCFRDIVFKLDNNCPHLFAYGEKRSGKSKFMESLSNFFFTPLRTFNLNSGTDFAFANYLGRFANCLSFMNEFDDKAIREEWFQALKAAYDGEGRMRGKGGSRNRTETMPVRSTIALAGQYLSTRDDMALLSRCIVRAFQPNDKRSKKQNEAYDQLKQMEEQGINSLVGDLMLYRRLVEDRYRNVFHECFAEMKDWCTRMNEKFEDRVNRNYCSLLTMCKIFEKELKLPFTYTECFLQIMNDVVYLTKNMSEGDYLAEFWRIVGGLADSGELIRGFHYRIKHESEFEPKDREKMHFGAPKPLLYLRLGPVHTAYRKAARSETGKEGMDAGSLRGYFENREYWVGTKDSVRFRGTDKYGKEQHTSPTSAYVFDYGMMEKLGIFLDYSPENAAENVEPGKAVNNDLPFENKEDKKQEGFWND